MNFPESSLANLSSLGYTEDEARFLYVVATHSGYFSMRQFLQFTGTKSGDKSMAFSQKLLGKGHATARSFLRNLSCTTYSPASCTAPSAGKTFATAVLILSNTFARGSLPWTSSWRICSTNISKPGTTN
jgi:hypothetical protein